jgi:hypothetical protein
MDAETPVFMVAAFPFFRDAASYADAARARGRKELPHLDRLTDQRVEMGISAKKKRAAGVRHTRFPLQRAGPRAERPHAPTRMEM